MLRSRSRDALTTVLLMAFVLIAATPAAAEPQRPNAKTTINRATAQECELLDDAVLRGMMDGLLFALAWRCERPDLLGEVEPEFMEAGKVAGTALKVATDGKVNNDSGTNSTQSETSIIQNLDTGTLCSGYNDSCEFFCPGGGGGFTGFSRSTDGGVTWDDRGALGATSFGDPSVVWRRADGNFYFAALDSGLGIHRSTDDCMTFSFVTLAATGGDDKELMTVDNTGGTHDGNLYLTWTDFGAGNLAFTRSVDAGATWSPQIALEPGIGLSPMPIVAPNGDVYVTWMINNGATISIRVARSTDGGVSFANVTNPATDVANPRDLTATVNCGRNALNGNLRYLAGSQIAITDDGTLHVVYSYDPDGQDIGDTIDVFYRRSTDNGTTWSPEKRLNDDATTSDQYFPTLSARGNTVLTTFYDRRLDAANLLQDTFRAVSTDGGVTWGPNERVSDVSTSINLDGNLATCYHGDYDQSLVTADGLIAQWSDDREAGELADTYTDAENGLFKDGFETGDTTAWSSTN